MCTILPVIIISLILHFNSLVNANDENELLRYIATLEHKMTSEQATNPSKYVDIKLVKQNSDTLCAFYQNNGRNCIAIFKEDSIFSNRYKYVGRGYGSSEFETYNFFDGRTKKALIVVYGDNTTIHASEYQFINSDKTYTNKIDNNYVLDIYIISNAANPSSNGYLYDKYGNIICML